MDALTGACGPRAACAAVRARCGAVGLALLPAVVCAVYFCGACVLGLIAVTIAAALATEVLGVRLMGRAPEWQNGSAALTGLLLALALPPDVPWALAVAGAVFAIAVVKLPFGGWGGNPFNPALAALAFLYVSFPGAMRLYRASAWSVSAGLPEVETTATPLACAHAGAPAIDWTSPDLVTDLFFGNVNGALGEVSAWALIVGGAYLLVRRIIAWQIPFAFLGTMGVWAAVAGGVPPAVHLFSGGALLGALFMATDSVTTPRSGWGRLVFGGGCGVLTMLIRTVPSGTYPEGVAFAILVMNAFTPLIDRLFRVPVSGGRS